ncbi:MAG TPA: type I 3-dehydroquinate dehydratase [Desulfatiglandales bacterium]|nr:type I 3-dehydroquinate dehydratase [Desulfatiglandales bacterium]
MFCIPIIARDTEEALRKMAVAAPLADIVEVRLDLMGSFELGPIIRSSVKPVLITYRSEKEGGMGKADPDTVAGYLVSAIKEGAHLIDLELGMPQKARKRILDARGGTKAIISTHINGRTPSRNELKRIFNESVGAGGDIVKIVARASRWDDNFRVLDLIPEARDKDVDIIAFCTGPLGRMSRIFSLLMGAHMTFTSIQKGEESAEGQIPIMEMKELLEFFTP